MGRSWGPLDTVTRFLKAVDRGEVVWDPAQERYETRDGNVVEGYRRVGAAQCAR